MGCRASSRLRWAHALCARYKVIVDTQGFEAEVENDWTGFRASDAVRQLHQRTAEQTGKVAQDLAAEGWKSRRSMH